MLDVILLFLIINFFMILYGVTHQGEFVGFQNVTKIG